MTKDQIRRQLHGVLEEFFDGYVVVGRVPESGNVVIMTHAQEENTKLRLLAGVVGVLRQMTEKSKSK